MQGARYSPYNFITAVRKGNIEKVREIISSCDLSNLQEWPDALDGYLLLLIALWNKRTDIAKLLLTNGFQVNKNTREPCNTPLHYAIRNGDIEIVQMLLDRGANINIQSLKSKTPLHIAVEDKKMDIIGILLNHGASVEIYDIRNMTPLLTAVKNNSTEIVKLLLSRGANVNATTCYRVGKGKRKGCTSLHLAVEKANEEMIKLLLSSGANVNAKRNDGITSLHIAIKRRYLQIVEHLLKSGASVNAVYTAANQEGYTPLHLAAKIDAEEITKLLLSEGANVNAQGNEDITPLHIATRAGYLKIVKHLLKYGADVHSTSRNGYTPLYFAVEHKHEKVVELLIKCGACVNAKDKNNKNILYHAVTNGNSIIVEHILKHSSNPNNESNSNILNVAIWGCGIEYSQIVKNLLQYGFTVTCENANCMLVAIEKGYVEIVKELLKYGAQVNKLYKSTLGKDSIPLHSAIKNGQEKIAKLLICYGADVNAPDETGNTPIFYATENADVKTTKLLLARKVNVKNKLELLNNAVRKGCREIVEIFLQLGVDVNAVDTHERTPLHFVVVAKGEKGYNRRRNSLRDPNAMGEVAKLLLSKGANANTKIKNYVLVFLGTNTNPSGETTMLHAAVHKGYVKVVEALLEYNADINATHENGLTPLHLAAEQGNEVIIKMLLNKGANIHAKTDRGITAVEYANIRDHADVVELLLKYGANINGDTTLLHCAAAHGNLKIAQILLKFGASIDATNEDGLTALHIATMRGHENIVRALVEHGSDITVKSEGHYTALDFAMYRIKLLCSFNDSFEFDHEDGNPDISPYINIAEILKRHIIKMKTANLIAQNDGILSIKSDDEELIVGDYPSEYKIKILRVYNKMARKKRRLSRNDFQNKCKKEIAHMKSKKFANTNTSFYDILTRSADRLAMYARNENIIVAFESSDYKENFPIYVSMLNSNFRKGEKKKELLEPCYNILNLLFNDCPALPRVCTEKILSYLKDDDLKVLADVSMPTVHCQQSLIM